MEQVVLKAARGAIQVVHDGEKDIVDAMNELFSCFQEKNPTATQQNIVTIFLTVTNDLISLNPATALRRSFSDFQVALFCMQEPDYFGSLPRTIRMLVQWYAPEETTVVPVYIGGAKTLRPDLFP